MHGRIFGGAFRQWHVIVWLVTLCCISVQVNAETLQLEAGMQQRYQFGMQIDRVAVGDPKVADVSVIDSHELLITPLAAGSTNLTVWPEKGSQVLELILQVKTAELAKKEALKQLETPEYSVEAVGESMQLEGEIDSLEQHVAVRQAIGFDEEKDIDASEFNEPSQVQIDIKIVEISKSRLQSAGFTLGKLGKGITRAIAPPEAITSATFSGSGLALSGNPIPDSEAFNMVFGRQSNGLLAALSMLEGNGFAYTLAEPSLIAMSGQSANFLAGGEFPVPVRGATGTDNSVTVEYKEFGVRLSLTPTVLAKNRIALKVAPEVSELDFNAGIQSGGVTVPALRVRRTDTSVALGNGESFVISGLISQNTIANVDKLPGLGDIPVLGAFFRKNQLNREDRELLMVVTPHLVQPLARDAALPELPGEQYRNYDPNFAEFFFLENGRFGKRPVSSGFSR